MCWNIKHCMATNKSGRKCNNNPINGNDFCKCHILSHQYNKKALIKQSEIQKDVENNKHINKLNIKYIDMIIDKFRKIHKEKIKEFNKTCEHCLLGLNNSWNEIPFQYWIHIDNLWWDIRTLNKIFTSQLNQTELENPYPVYLENPFTRNKISVDDICKLKYHVSLLVRYFNFNIHISLNTFIKLPSKMLNNIRDTSVQYDVACMIIKQFAKKLRFKTINYKDSQGRYCGYWVPKKEKYSQFETYYHKAIAFTLMPNNENIPPFFEDFIYVSIFKRIEDMEPEEYNF